MSGTATPMPEQEQRARWNALLADADRNCAETRKRLAEARARDRWLVPVLWIVVAAVLSGGAAAPLVIQLPGTR